MNDRSEGNDDRLERHLERELRRRNLTRRDLVKGGTGMAGAVGLASFLAACGDDDDGESASTTGKPEKFTGTLKVIGLGVDLIDPIKEAGEKALGFPLEFEVTDTVTMTQRALTQPQSFDVFSGYVENFDQIWGSGNFIAVDRSKILRWDEVTNLVKLGRVDPRIRNAQPGRGTRRFESCTWTPSRRRATARRPGRARTRPPKGRSRPGSSACRPTSTWTRWATTPTSSRGAGGGLLGRALQPEVPGPRGPAQRPGHRAPGRRDGRQGARPHDVRDKGNMTKEEIDGIVQDPRSS